MVGNVPIRQLLSAIALSTFAIADKVRRDHDERPREILKQGKSPTKDGGAVDLPTATPPH